MKTALISPKAIASVSFILVLVLTSWSIFPRTATATVPNDEAAKKHFQQGVAFFQDEDYDAAYVEFEASYNANGNFKVLYNLGLALQALHEYVKAESVLKKFLTEGVGKIPSDELAEVNDILLDLQYAIGTVVLACSEDGAAVTIDDEDRGTTPLLDPVRLDAGSHMVVVTKEGFEPWVTKLSLTGGVSITIEIAPKPLQPAPPPEQPAAVGIAPPTPEVETEHEPPAFQAEETGGKKGFDKIAPVPFFTFLGLTLAAGAGTAIAAGVGKSKHDAFVNTDPSNFDRKRSLADDGKKAQTATNVLLVATGTLALTTVILAAVTDFGKAKEEKQATVIPLVGPGQVGMTMAF